MGVAAVGMVVGVEAAFTVEAVGFMVAEAVGSADLAAFTAEAAVMVAGPTWVMGGVVTAFRLAAFMDMDLLATP